MSDAKLIVGKIRQIRRRLFFLRLAGSTALACCIFGIAAVLFTFESLRFYRSPGPWLGILGTGLAIVILIFSVLSMPPQKEIVRRVDRRLDLQQRLETAWECLNPREDIDRILLRDANSRVFSISPAAAVPFRINRTTGTLLTIGLLAFATVSLIRLLDGSAQLKLASLGNIRQTAAENPLENETGADQTHGNNRGQGATGYPADSGSAAVRNAPAVSGNTKEEITDGAVLQMSPVTSSAGGGEQESLGFNGNELPSAAFPFHQTASENTDIAAQRPDVSSAEAELQAPTRPPDPADTANDPDTSSSSSTGTSGRRKNGDTESASAGTRIPQPAGNDTGDIPAAGKTIQPAGKDPSAEEAATLRNRPSLDYTSLRIAAERAIAREKIPPGLKKYIADYFLAIQP